MRCISVALLLSFVFTLSGCGVLLDSAREIAGYPSLELLRARKNAVKQSFDISYDEAFKKVLAILKEDMEAVIYQENKKERFIVAMGIKGNIDTTEVYIFFIEEAPNRTIVEISSHSPKAKKVVSEEIFSTLARGEIPAQGEQL